MSAEHGGSVTDHHIVKLRGALNIVQAGEVIRLFRDLYATGIRRVVVDLAEVPFIDSPGLSALIAGYKLFGADACNFRLSGVQDQPRLVFELTGFDHVFGLASHAGGPVSELPASEASIQAVPGFSVLALVL